MGDSNETSSRLKYFYVATTVSNCGHVAREKIESSCCHQKLLKTIKITIIIHIENVFEIIYAYIRSLWLTSTVQNTYKCSLEFSN